MDATLRSSLVAVGVALVVLGLGMTTEGVQRAMGSGWMPPAEAACAAKLWGSADPSTGGHPWRPGRAEGIGWVVAATGAGLAAFALSRPVERPTRSADRSDR